jgi:hypothetical protein
MLRNLLAVVVVVLAAIPAAALAADPPQTIVVRSPVGKQYALVGVGSSLWLGSGAIRTLDNDGRLDQTVGEYDDRAWGVGPVWVGLSQMVSPSVMFEARLGAGALVFENDRLVSNDLSGRGDTHVGLLLEAEVLGRYLTSSGLAFSMGVNFGSVALPDSTGALMRASPRVGYLQWTEHFEGFWLLEAGYQFPVINGLEPDIEGVRRDPPVTSTWHIITLGVTRGF